MRVARKGMEARPFLRDDGRMVVVFGQAQRTAGDALNLHARSIGTYVDELARHGRIRFIPDMPERHYLYIAQNRSVRTCVADAQTGKRLIRILAECRARSAHVRYCALAEVVA
jgi:hypothetical protein